MTERDYALARFGVVDRDRSGDPGVVRDRDAGPVDGAPQGELTIEDVRRAVAELDREKGPTEYFFDCPICRKIVPLGN